MGFGMIYAFDEASPKVHISYNYYRVGKKNVTVGIIEAIKVSKPPLNDI